MVLPFHFPRPVVSAIAGLEEAKNLAGRSPPPDSDPFNDAQFGKNLAYSSRKFDRQGESLIPVRRTQSAFHPRAR